jgi:hypothetical protein
VFDGGVDVPELGVTVGHVASGPGLGHALQTEAHLMQQVADDWGADRMAGVGQLPGQVPQ